MTSEPRQRDADRSRAQILDAAERLFAERGFEGVTLAQIGAGAGVSRGTPGYFFGTKNDLYREVLRRAAATFAMFGETLKVRAAAENRTGDALIVDTTRSFAQLLRSRPDAVRLLDRDGGELGHPQVDALRGALSSLGEDADAVVYRILALTWFAAAHPDLAAALDVDLADDGALARLVAADGTGSPGVPPSVVSAGAPEDTPEEDDPVASAEPGPSGVFDTAEAAAVVLALKKKKKKKGKKKKA